MAILASISQATSSSPPSQTTLLINVSVDRCKTSLANVLVVFKGWKVDFKVVLHRLEVALHLDNVTRVVEVVCVVAMCEICGFLVWECVLVVFQWVFSGWYVMLQVVYVVFYALEILGECLKWFALYLRVKSVFFIPGM